MSVSLTDVRGFAIRTPDGRTVEFRVGQLENGAQFPPGHLAEHQVDSVPIRVTYRDENGEHVADPARGRAGRARLAEAGQAPASISSGAKISSNDALTIAVAADDEDERLRQQAVGVGRRDGLELFASLEHRLELAVDVLRAGTARR